MMTKQDRKEGKNPWGQNASTWFETQKLKRQPRSPQNNRCLLGNMQKSHLEAFLKQDFPAKKHKWWQFSNISEVIQKTFHPISPENTPPPVLNNPFYVFPNMDRLHFQNGRGSFLKSSAPKALSKDSSSWEWYQWPEWGAFPAKAWLKKQFKNSGDPWQHLSGALTTTGYALFVPDNYVSPTPLHIHFSFNSFPETHNLWNMRNFIFMGKQARLSLLESVSYQGHSFVNGVTDIKHSEDSQLKWIKIDEGHTQSYYCHQSFCEMEKSSCLDRLNISLGSGLSRDSIQINQTGSKASSSLLGLSVLKQKNRSDQRMLIHHTLPDSCSQQFFRGVLNDSAHNIFHGKTFISPKAHGTNCQQSAKTLLLSDQAVSHTLPELDIQCSEVQAGHGAATGVMNPDEKFYLQSRGLHQKTAAELLIFSYIQEVFNQFPPGELIDQINKKFQKNKRELLNLQ